MKNKIFVSFALLLLLLFSSCNKNTTIYEGKALVINRSFDDSLQDSVMIYGYVLSAADENPFWNSSTILIEDTKTSTVCDSSGFFSLKLLSGTYTVICFDPSVTDDTLKLENLKTLPNEKVEIKFLKRVVVW